MCYIYRYIYLVSIPATLVCVHIRVSVSLSVSLSLSLTDQSLQVNAPHKTNLHSFNYSSMNLQPCITESGKSNHSIVWMVGSHCFNFFICRNTYVTQHTPSHTCAHAHMSLLWRVLHMYMPLWGERVCMYKYGIVPEKSIFSNLQNHRHVEGEYWQPW